MSTSTYTELRGESLVQLWEDTPEEARDRVSEKLREMFQTLLSPVFREQKKISGGNTSSKDELFVVEPYDRNVEYERELLKATTTIIPAAIGDASISAKKLQSCLEQVAGIDPAITSEACTILLHDGVASNAGGDYKDRVGLMLTDDFQLVVGGIRICGRSAYPEHTFQL